MKKIIIITISLFLGSFSVSAQNWCGTVEHREDLINNNPATRAELERRFDSFNKLQQSNANRGVKNNNHYIFPVVFHVIHVGGSENISLLQIEDQMRILNEDFARLNPDTVNCFFNVSIISSNLALTTSKIKLLLIFLKLELIK